MAPLKDDAWFSGFTDGEGCFSFDGSYKPRFSIALRIDDLPVLEKLSGVFGGGITLRRSRGTTNAQAQWTVTKKSDLLSLVQYFEAFPLQAKKRHDFTIWRRGVLIYCEKGRGKARAELTMLCETLRGVRRFDSDVEDFHVPDDSQLRLIEGGLP